jgi:hypothetical protein
MTSVPNLTNDITFPLVRCLLDISTSLISQGGLTVQYSVSLGSGAYGHVHKGFWKKTVPVSIKDPSCHYVTADVSNTFITLGLANPRTASEPGVCTMDQTISTSPYSSCLRLLLPRLQTEHTLYSLTMGS